ncbi:MAG: hypothetical protein AAGJ28_21925 [Pseudomonadota bacterium]
MGGKIVDAIIVPAPRQRMTNDGKEIVKGDGILPDWQARPRKPAQKDRDASWTLKHGRKIMRLDGCTMMEVAMPVFGCSSHINNDRCHGFARRWSITGAARHAGRESGLLSDRGNTVSRIRAGTAYRTRKNEKQIARAGLTSNGRCRKPSGTAMSAHQ